MIPRRQFLRQAGAAGLAASARSSLAAFAEEKPGVRLTPAAEIEERTRKARPLLGGTIPRNLADRLGVTHHDGHYLLTDKPFLVEGAEKISQFGMKVRVVPIDTPMVHTAVQVVDRYGIGYYDALIVVAADRAGCHTIHSEDLNAGQQYLGVTVRNPFA